MQRAMVCRECISADFAVLGENKVWRYGTFERLLLSAISEHCQLCTIMAKAFARNLAKGKGKDDWQVLAVVIGHAVGDGEEQMKGQLKAFISRPDYVDLVHQGLESLPRSRSISLNGMFNIAKVGKAMLNGFWRNIQDPTPRGPALFGKAEALEAPSKQTPASARHLPFPSADASGIYEMIRKWMTECKTSHGQLCNEDLASKTPKRYLDVHLDSDRSYVELIEKIDNEAVADCRYAALSYSWGRPPFVTTTLDNIHDHKQGMLVEDLPPTIHDAVKVTRELAIPYLWVDSLCILQGPAGHPEVMADHDEQFPQMGMVYSNAFLTIIAANTTTVNESFLTLRTKIQAQWVLLDRTFYDATREPAWYAQGAKVLPAYQLDRQSWRGTSDSRAWCLQEKMLSKRIISFHDEGVMYACRTTWRSEVDRNRGSMGDFTSLKLHILSKAYKKWFWAGALLNGAYGAFFQATWSDDVEWRYDFWTSLIEQYTSRNLTESNDRLRAAAGIAEVWQRVFDDEYYAGLWKSSVEVQLLWCHSGKRIGSSRQHPIASEYRAPSWSWAAVDGDVHFHFGLRHLLETVPTGHSSTSERAPKLVGTRYEQSVRVQNFDMKLIGTADIEVFVEDTTVSHLGAHILGYLEISSWIRMDNKLMLPSLPIEDFRDSDLHWSGTFFDSGSRGEHTELYYLETLRFDMVYPKRGPSSKKTRLSSG